MSNQFVTIRDCGPRDGLQSEQPVAAAQRARLAMALAESGLSEVEVAAFVSPKAVPSMAGAIHVLEDLEQFPSIWWVLVPNRRGAELAVEAGATKLSMTVSASALYGLKNVGMTIPESINEISSVLDVDGVEAVDVVVSCAFGSPFDEDLRRSDVVKVVNAVAESGAHRITLADTIGSGSPNRVEDLIHEVGCDVGLHLHDTRGTALTSAYRAIQLGVRRFDTAIGGLGGSPFAPGAGGNLATEDLVLLLDELGLDCGIDLGGILKASQLAAELVGHPVPSRVAAAGPLPVF